MSNLRYRDVTVLSPEVSRQENYVITSAKRFAWASRFPETSEPSPSVSSLIDQALIELEAGASSEKTTVGELRYGDFVYLKVSI